MIYSGSYQAIKLLEHGLKVLREDFGDNVKRISEY